MEPVDAPTLVGEIVLLSTALSAVALSIYVRTLCPSVPGGDSGEMVQVAIELGVAHPPGYPTWTLLAHAFSRLPWGEPAWRINLFSAVADAAASGLLSAAVGLWAGCAWTGLVAGGAFAFAPLVWLYAVQAEVFALNNAINALLLLLLVRFERSRSLGAACAGACAIGLALTNQHTLVFFCVPYAVWALALGRSTLLTPRALLCLALSGLLGLTPYAYCVVQGGPDAAWGSWGAQRSVGGLLTHVLRREYGTFRLANTDSTTDSEFWPRLAAYLAAVPGELPPYAPPLLGLGTLRSLACARLRPVGGVLVAAYLLYVTVFMYLSNLPTGSAFYLQIQQRFWPQPNMLTCAWFALGLQRAARALAPHTRAPLAVAALVLVGWHAQRGFEAGDQSRNDIFRQYGVRVLEALPDKPGVLLLTHGDEVLNSVRYAHRVLGVRPNVTVLDQNYMQFEWFVARAKRQPYFAGLTFPGTGYGTRHGDGTRHGAGFVMYDLLEANYHSHSIYVCGGVVPADRSWEGAYQLWPLGLAAQMLRRDAAVKLDRWAAKTAKLLPQLAWRAGPPVEGSWEATVATNHYLAAYTQRPYAVLQRAYERPGAPDERALFHLAAQMYEATAALEPSLNGSVALPDYFFRNLGVAWSQLIRLEPREEGRAGAKQRAAAAFMRYLRFDTISTEDRTAVEQGVLSLIPTPGAPAGALEAQHAQQDAQRAAAAQQQPPPPQQQQQQPPPPPQVRVAGSGAPSKKKSKKKKKAR